MKQDKFLEGFQDLGATIAKLKQEEKKSLFYNAALASPWYTPENIERALKGISLFLKNDILSSWLKKYPRPEHPKKVGLIMAGNIPLVGFHDLLCTLGAGHKAIIKLSRQDEVLPKYIINLLIEYDPEFGDNIEIVERLSGIDAVIATGSDNSSRYFRKYFKDYPHIIRKNRTSVTVLTGNETKEELASLADDIFSYFGMGCRNVSKLYIPSDFKMEKLIPHFQPHEALQKHNKYFNNYEYNKAIYLVNMVDHLDNGFAHFVESPELVSPLSVIYFERYETLDEVQIKLDEIGNKLQCVVGNIALNRTVIPFGKAQSPEIDDYADDVDTMEFLSSL